MMELFKKAQLGLALTPGERATLKTLQSLFISALVVGCMAGGGYILSGGNLDWRNAVYVIIFAILVSFGHGLAKYVTAHGDLPAGTAIEDIAEAIAAKTLPLLLQQILAELSQSAPPSSSAPQPEPAAAKAGQPGASPGDTGSPLPA